MEKSIKAGLITTSAIALVISLSTLAKDSISLESKASNEININLKKSFNKIKDKLRPANYYMPIMDEHKNLNPKTDDILDWVFHYRDGSIDTLYGKIDYRGKLIYTRTKP